MGQMVVWMVPLTPDLKKKKKGTDTCPHYLSNITAMSTFQFTEPRLCQRKGVRGKVIPYLLAVPQRRLQVVLCRR